ncbi:hypothetical protein NSK_001327 [Nannochloropsis salina CCMP1776]|uniref:RING-type domain-containing protein n=1 Tax=Nannochloropsis salina CCMP1776 TaxID=1027361 RepID=A0A4D9DAD5_9STRA|nr:hypothetical protein NSK_001327 [Nannochloropsis salina CCMP1776]|eukprot:TFJ86993.1 hypothetical protein NSK_001327 [Nannochloropsis salina CCMP1776]
MQMDCQMGEGPVRTCERGPYVYHFDSFFKGPSVPRLNPCVICLEPIEEGADLTSLLGCEDRHHFHANCINSWLERNATCPTCRKGATRFPFLRRMAESPLDPSVQYQGLLAIVKTASVEGPPQYSIQNVTRLGELGACRLIVTAMRTFSGDRCIQLMGLEAIEALAAKSEGARANFQQESAEELFTRIFEMHTDDKDLQTAACQALVGLATGHPEWQNRLGLAGLCSRVTESLRQWPDDYGIQLSGLYAINALLSRHEANTQRVFEAGASAILVYMMKTFWRDLDVLDGAITAIYSLSSRGAVERSCLGQLDCCRVLLAVMAAHPDARDLQVKCCFAIAKLAWQHAENRHRLVALKAALVVTQIFNKHPFDVAIHVAGSAAMVALYMPLALAQRLAEKATTILLNKTAFLLTSPSAQHKFHHHLPSVLANGSESPPLQQAAGWNRENPAKERPTEMNGPTGDGDGRAEAQAFQALVRALATIPAESELEISASPALLFLLEVVNGRHQLLDDQPTASNFVAAMENYARDEDSQDIYLEVAILITDASPTAREMLLQSGITRCVLDLMKRYLSVASLQEKCCMVLATLTEESPETVERVWNEQMMAALVDVVKAHPSQPVLQHFALSCLQNLAEDGSPLQRSSLITPSVLSLAALSLALHPTDEDIGSAALGLIVSLAAQEMDSPGQIRTCQHASNLHTNGNGNGSHDQANGHAEVKADCNGDNAASTLAVPSGPSYVRAVLSILRAVWKQIHSSSSVASFHSSYSSNVLDEKEIKRLSALGILRWLTLVARDCAPDEVAIMSDDASVHTMFEEVAGGLAISHPRSHSHAPSTLMLPPPPAPPSLLSQKRSRLSSFPNTAAASSSLIDTAEMHGKRLCLDLVASLPQRDLETSWPRACGAVVGGLQEGKGRGAVTLSALAGVVALAEGNEQNKSVLQGLGAGKGLSAVAAVVETRERELLTKAQEALR